MKNPNEDPEIFEEAVIAYYAWCKKTGSVVDQPARERSEIGSKYVYLRNSERLLAKYNFREGKIEAGK